MNSMPDKKLLTDKRQLPCVILIGMAGAGKTTIGALLAKALNWAFMDSDHLIEALYAARLQDITNFFGKNAFLDIEAGVVCSIRMRRCVIATGGSVVYRQAAMDHLASLGTLVHLTLPLETIKERIARNPERGLAIAPHETIEDIYAERKALYEQFASISCDTEKNTPDQCVRLILEDLKKSHKDIFQSPAV